MAVWRLQVNTGGANVADYCLQNHVAAMGWSLDGLTPLERSGILYLFGLLYPGQDAV